jgi:lysyl-tRNA synthetase class 2
LKVNGSYIVKHHPNGHDTEEVLEIDFTPPFKRIHMIKGLEEKIGERLP